MLTSLDVEPALDHSGAWPWMRSSEPLRAELVPEVVLPEQFAALRHNGDARPPEHRLMLAVLEDAVHTYLSRGRDPRTPRDLRLFHDAADWFASDETASPFAFVTICQVWSLDPDYIRSGLARWHTRGDMRAVPLPFRIRRVSGSRHHVNLSSAERRRARARQNQ
jgi:hypothetical protein